jgi:hypothetical protein
MLENHKVHQTSLMHIHFIKINILFSKIQNTAFLTQTLMGRPNIILRTSFTLCNYCRQYLNFIRTCISQAITW